MTARDAILGIDDVSLRFGGLQALDRVSIDVPRGSIIGIIGPNGAGKTSLLNCVSGAYRPQAGRIVFEGRELLGRRPWDIAAAGISRTFQSVQIVPAISVLDNVLIGRHIRQRRNLFAALLYWGLGSRVERAQCAFADEVLEQLGIAGLRDREASTLPYGQQRLVEIARALASEPRLLFLDEPTSGMNHSERADVAGVVQSLRRDQGLTQVIVEHDIGFIAELCDHVVVLNFGRIIARGTPQEVLDHPAVIEAYLGTGPGNALVGAQHETARGD